MGTSGTLYGPDDGLISWKLKMGTPITVEVSHCLIISILIPLLTRTSNGSKLEIYFDNMQRY